MSTGLSLYLDMVRLLAAIAVVLYHANLIHRLDVPVIASLGHEAVVTFFVLSGFVIAYVADRREETLRTYTVARAARIYSVALPAVLLTGLLDFAGWSIASSVYPSGYQAWGFPLLRALSSLLFVNEFWTASVQTFSNVPYWSLNYEVCCYAGFGILTFVEGRQRWGWFAAMCLLVGPKILLLMPVWWMGTWVYRSQTMSRLSKRDGWLCLLLSLCGGWLYLRLALGRWSWMWLQALVGDTLHQQMGYSRQFLGDYCLAAIVALHFAGVRAIFAGVTRAPNQAIRAIRYLAGCTFSLYLFHQPLLWFFAALASPAANAELRYRIVVPATLLSCVALASFTEHRKSAYKQRIDELFDRVAQRRTRGSRG